jgi:hypothetical protein
MASNSRPLLDALAIDPAIRVAANPMTKCLLPGQFLRLGSGLVTGTLPFFHGAEWLTMPVVQ